MGADSNEPVVLVAYRLLRLIPLLIRLVEETIYPTGHKIRQLLEAWTQLPIRFR